MLPKHNTGGLEWCAELNDMKGAGSIEPGTRDQNG
jgi:hypothetical protein